MQAPKKHTARTIVVARAHPTQEGNPPAHADQKNTIAPTPQQRYSKDQILNMTGISRESFAYHRRIGVIPPPIGGKRYATYDYRHVHIAAAIAKRQKQPDIRVVARSFLEDVE